MNAETRRSEAHLAASFVLTLLTASVVVALCRVFPDWDYLRPMLAVAVGTHVVALVLRVLRTPVWVAMPLIVLAAGWLLAVVYYRDTLTFVFPSGRTLELARIDLRLVLDQFSTAVAPVPSEGSFATAIAAVVALCAALSDTFAFRAFGRVEAVVPTGVLFVFTSALGTDRHRVAVAALWIGLALLTVALLRFDQSDHDGSWMGSRRLTLAAALPAIAVTIAVTAVAAGALGPRLPGAGKEALIDTRNREGTVTEVLNPFVDIRARMKNRGNTELFTVQSSDGPHYWRVIALPDFDGNTWSPTGESLRDVGDRSGDVQVGAARVVQSITVKSLGGNLLPAAYYPVVVNTDRVLWAGESQSLVLEDNTTLQRNDSYIVASLVISPDPALLDTATVSGAASEYYQVPSGFPATAQDLAVEVTAAATTPYQKALALQNWFRSEFQYNLNVQLGNSNDAIEAFLRDRQGFCQQFAGTFAAMARWVGLPARVAVGYTPGDYGNDGLYHVYGRHAHAWPEVWFDGIGWVAFEPTPGRGSPDAQRYTGVDPAQDDTHGQGNGGTGGTANTGPTTTSPRRPGDPDLSTTVPGQGRPGGPGGSSTTTPRLTTGSSGGSSSSAVPVVLVSAVMLLVLWVLLAPRVLAALQRAPGTPRERVIRAWYRTCHSLGMAGAPPVRGSTPLEYADQAELAVGLDHRTLRELAVQVTRAVYSTNPIDESVAARCETLQAEVDAMCRPRTPWALRLRELVDPRMMRRRFG